MKVFELIKLLADYPIDLDVVIEYDGDVSVIKNNMIKKENLSIYKFKDKTGTWNLTNENKNFLVFLSTGHTSGAFYEDEL